MDNLLRNSEDSVSMAPFGKGVLRDPEFHIRRLAHFGAGMGIDLTTSHPTTVGKGLFSSTAYSHIPLSNELNFEVTSEGLLPSAHLRTKGMYIDKYKLRPIGMGLRPDGELKHRSPFDVHAFADNPDNQSGIEGSIYKNAFDHSKHLPFPQSEWGIGMETTWGNTGQEHPSFKDALKSIEAKFNEINRTRTVDPRINNFITEHSNSEEGKHFEQTKHNDLWKTKPQELSSQFLEVYHHDHKNDLAFNDVIDLKTGNWAKRDSEGNIII